MPTRKVEPKGPLADSPGPGRDASRPHFPPEYGAARTGKGLLPWSHLSGRMREAQHYWICTVTPDGQPHARPLDGIWLNDRLYVGGSPATRWRRNLDANPSICVHLESAMDVVLLHGTARLEAVDAQLGRDLADASKKKYGYAPKPEEYVKNGVLAFRPRVAYAWTNLAKDPTRWTFGGPGSTSRGGAFDGLDAERR